MKPLAAALSLGLALGVPAALSAQEDGQGSESSTVGVAVVETPGTSAASAQDAEYVEGCPYCEYQRPSVAKRWWKKFKKAYHEAHDWPHPYADQARVSTRAILGAQVAKGWARNNTLHSYHFDAESHQLNRAGKIQLQLIVHKSPPERRMVFVQAASDAEATEARLQDVRQTVCAWIGKENAPPMGIVNTTTPGARAEELYIERQKYMGSIPTPRLQASGGASAGGGGGQSSGGSGGGGGK